MAFAAADAHHAAAAVLFQNGDQTIDLNVAAFAAEAFRMATDVVAVQTFQHFLSRQLHHEVIGNHEKAVRQVFGVLPKQRGCIWSLEIFGWRLNNF